MFNAINTFAKRKLIKTLNALDSLESLVDRTKTNILKRNKEIDSALLGRSLACNPFMPRFCNGVDECRNISCIEIFDDSELHKIDTQSKDYNAIIVNTILKSDVSLLSNARIYTPYWIIHSDIIISTYQILESVVYGADIVILICDALPKESFCELSNYAMHLGLAVCALVKNSDEIEFATEIGVDFFILQDTSLFPLIHKNIISIKY